MGSRKYGRHASPWKSIFASVSTALAYITFAGIIVGALCARLPGALGFLAGSLLVFLWFTADIVVADRAEKISMVSVGRAWVISYVFKVMLGMVVLFLVPLPTIILNGWMLCGAIVAVCVWLGISMKTIMNLRILYFDEHDGNLTRTGRGEQA